MRCDFHFSVFFEWKCFGYFRALIFTSMLDDKFAYLTLSLLYMLAWLVVFVKNMEKGDDQSRGRGWNHGSDCRGVVLSGLLETTYNFWSRDCGH